MQVVLANQRVRTRAYQSSIPADRPSSIFVDRLDSLVKCVSFADKTVQFSDERSRLILIRTPRTLAPKVRAVLTLMTSLQVTKNKATPVVVSVLGVHGSLRTAKKSVLMCIRHSYMDYLKTLGPRLNEKDKLAVAQSLESVLQTVYEIEF